MNSVKNDIEELLRTAERLRDTLIEPEPEPKRGRPKKKEEENSVDTGTTSVSTRTLSNG